MTIPRSVAQDVKLILPEIMTSLDRKVYLWKTLIGINRQYTSLLNPRPPGYTDYLHVLHSHKSCVGE